MRIVSCCVVAVLLASCGEVVKPKPDLVPPTLTSVAPARGTVSTMLTLTGSDFGDTQDDATITIGGVTATVQSWSSASIVAAIPDVLPGDAGVIVTTAGGATGPQTVRVILPPRVYVENNANAADGFDAITVMSFDPATGALAQLGTSSMGVPFAGFGGCANSLVVHEPTRRLFATGTTGVAVFAIDPATGMLTPVAGSPFPTGSTSGNGIDIDAAAHRLWRVNAGNLAVFDIAPTGALTAVPGSPFVATPGVDILATSRDGTFVYANTESNVFHAFSVTANGALTPLPGSPYMTAGFSFSITRRPAREQFYITVGQTLQVWQAATGTGVPSQIPGSPFAFTVPSGTPHFVAFTPDGSRAYIGTHSAPHLVGMNINAAGAASVIPGSPWTFTGTIGNFSCMAVARETNHLIVADDGGKRVAVFALGADGKPTHVPGSPFATTSPENASGLAITF